MKYIEYIGLIKFDFLGLRNLSIISDTIECIKKRYNIQLSEDNIPLDDPKTFKFFQCDDLEGVFQFEGRGVQNAIKQLKPTHIEDLIAVNALYRPGPIQYIPVYISRKHGKSEVVYPHPLTVDILKNTYGIIVYQEQVMALAVKCAGYSMGKADDLRRAMGKKNIQIMAEQKNLFIDGCIKNNINKSIAEKIFNDMKEFAGYAFNRAHAVTYGVLGYLCGYLKANYCREYLVSIMNSEIHDKEKVVCYLYNLLEKKIPLYPPDINASKRWFTIDNDGIRYGLGALRNMGDILLENIEKHQPYKDIDDFINKNFHLLNKKNWESLVFAGVFDQLVPDRDQLINRLSHSDLMENNTKPSTAWERLKNEQFAFNFFFTQPSLFIMENYSTKITPLAQYLKQPKMSKLCVEVLSYLLRKRKDNSFAFLKIIDHSAKLDLIVSGPILSKYETQLKDGNVLLLDMVYERGRHNIIGCTTIESYLNQQKKLIYITITHKKQLKQLKNLPPGPTLLMLQIYNITLDTNVYVDDTKLDNIQLEYQIILK